ncbi:hypothetical protein T458_24555 [Brevibacillus panacihumi W25]|uniref:Uncharacterized protein n=1 Tax=Brevibacillus panacihumi W25 TaxID=1408254 RepID=V6MA07_9BACL|nr:GTPase domain-containing protein [Brevibacillus panacihumi]EST52183.1 hypothetical protein T458_24555 [Brevibacillus panacihumi W25]
MKLIDKLIQAPSQVTLRPNGITALLFAPTASGKTTATAQFTTEEAARILRLTIGEGSSTIINRHLVFTNEIDNHIVVSVKPKTPYVSLSEFIHLVTSRMAGKISSYHKKLHTMDISDLESEVKKDLQIVFTNTINTKAQYSLASEEQRLIAVRLLCRPLATFLKTYGFEIFNHASNSLDANEAKKSSKKLKEAIDDKMLSFIESDPQVQDVLSQVYLQLNESLDQYFHSFFAKSDLSFDGYYFYIIDVNTPSLHKDFILAFFSNNNIQQGKKLSVEVLCDEIVIHLPMSKPVREAIEADKINHPVRSVYENLNGYYNFTLIDTQGLYHSSADENTEQERLENMLYRARYDALICLTPMHGNPNGTKFEIQLSQELTKFKKGAPVLLLCNKADEYADNLQKEKHSLNSIDDLFGDGPVKNSKDIQVEVLERAEQQTLSIKEALNQRKQGNAYVLPAMFKEPVSMQDKQSLTPLFGVDAVVKKIINVISENQGNAENFIKFRLSNNLSWTKQPSDVNTEKVFQCLRNVWEEAETKKQVIDPAVQNIAHNQGRRPQGNGFNALVRRLKIGEGWDSNIDRNYYKHFDSFHVRYPANLANLISASFIARLTESAVDYNGVFETEEDKKRFVTTVIQQLVSEDFAADVLYYQILSNLMKTAYTRQSIFDGLLAESLKLFHIDQTQFDMYAKFITNVEQEVPSEVEHVNMLVTALQRQMETALSLVFNKYTYLA